MIDLCESHANNMPATMLVTFDPNDRPFRVCEDCALDAAIRAVDVQWIDPVVSR